MVNILETQQKANKELLNEIEALKSRLADKDKEINELRERFGVNENNNLTTKEVRQQLIEALRDTHYTNNPDEELINDIMTYYPGTNWPGFCENFPIKNSRQGHITLLYQFTMYWKNSFKLWNTINELKDSKNELVKEKKELEEKTKELTCFKEQTEGLAKKVGKLLLDYSELSEEDIENERIYWQIGEPEELLEKIKKSELNELNEVVMRIIAKWEIDAKTHFISFTETGKLFNDTQKAELREDSENKAREIEEKSKRLREAKDRINEQELLIKKLQQELEDNSKKLEESRKKNKEQEAQIGELKRSLHYAVDKPLPSLPRKIKQNKICQLGAKIKTGFQKLVEKTKNQRQELIARIEIKTN